jgi:CRISPR-associated protein Cas2
MDIVVAYDINTETRAGERRLARVAAICERYGERAQYSVFECRLNDVRLARLVAELRDEINPRADSIHIYQLAGDIEHASSRIGRQRKHDIGQPWIL